VPTASYLYVAPKTATIVIDKTVLNNKEMIQSFLSVIFKSIFKVELIASRKRKTNKVIINSISSSPFFLIITFYHIRKIEKLMNTIFIASLHKHSFRNTTQKRTLVAERFRRGFFFRSMQLFIHP